MIIILFSIIISLLHCQVDKYEQIAQKFAPIIVKKGPLSDPIDWLVSMDYDGDFNLRNNHGAGILNRYFKSAPMTPDKVHIYYDVLETTNFYVIFYMLYHERNENMFTDHIQDSSSIVVFSDKNQDPNKGNILLVTTNVHGRVYTFPGNSEKVSLIKNLPPPDKEVNAAPFAVINSIDATSGNVTYYYYHLDTIGSKYIYRNHPVIYTLPKNHSIYVIRNSYSFADEYQPEAGFVVYKNNRNYSLQKLSNIISSNTNISNNNFNPNFFSTKKGLICWDKKDGKKGFLPTHFAEADFEKEPEADLPLNLRFRDMYIVLEPDKFLRSIGFTSEKLEYSPFENAPSTTKCP